MFKEILKRIPVISSPAKKILKEIALVILDRILNGDSDELGSKGKMDSDDVSDIIDYNSLLNKFLKELEQDMQQIESKIIKESTFYYDELLFLIKDIEQYKNINLNSRYIEKSINKEKEQIQGSLMKNFYSRFSLDNSELKNIIVMKEGELKKDKINKFKKNEIKHGLEAFIERLQLMLMDINGDISENINEILGDMDIHNQQLQEQFKYLQENNNKEEMKDLINKSNNKIHICDFIIKELGA